MKKLIKNNEGLITASIGLIWILLLGLIIMFGKYIWGKDNIKKNKETKP